MPLTESDFLKWYNDEITRYRNQEWQLASYSVTFSSAVILFVRRSDTMNMIRPWTAAITIMIFISLLIFAEFHVHGRLSEFRKRRVLLIENGNHNAKNVNDHFFNGTLDTIFFFGFVLFPAIFGIAAAMSCISISQ
ncbi:MAG: hypothetical protein WC007_06055 [Pelobacteraceae bacterium]